MRETWVQSQGSEDSLEKEMQPTPELLPGKSHGWRILVGPSSWGRTESDAIEQLHFHLHFHLKYQKFRYVYIFFHILSILVYHRILNIVPWIRQ